MKHKNEKIMLEKLIIKWKPIVYILILALPISIFQTPVQIIAQESGSYYLKRGMKKYHEDWDIAGAIIDLKYALSMGLSRDEKIQSYKLLAFCYSEDGEQNKAIDAFKNLLQIDPSFQLSRSISPTYYVPFSEVKKGFPYKPIDLEPPELQDMTEDSVLKGMSFPIRVMVQDNNEVARVVVGYKDGINGSANKGEMKKVENDIYEFYLQQVNGQKISYAVVAWDKAGNRNTLKTKYINVIDPNNKANDSTTNDNDNTDIPINNNKGIGKTLAWLGGITVVGGVIAFLTMSSNDGNGDQNGSTGFIHVEIPANP